MNEQLRTVFSNRIRLQKLAVCVLLFLAGFPLLRAQDANIPSGSPQYWLLERLEMKSGRLNNGIFLDALPITRHQAAEYIQRIPTDTVAMMRLKLRKQDLYWSDYATADNRPWSGAESGMSRKPILKYFYTSKANLYETIASDTSWALFINPVIAVSAGKASDSGGLLLRNTRGVEVRGMVDRKVGFYAFFTDNQVQFPSYVNQYISQYKVVPGDGYYKGFRNNGYDFFRARAYVTFSPTRHIHLQFGNDQNFIGNGFRSLLLSDFAKDYLNLKITTRFWKIQYQNIFTEFIDGQRMPVKPYPRKYGAFHYLSVDALKWLNFGLFEGIIFADYNNKGEKRGYELSYLNPIMFYRSAEQQLGSSDNTLLGANFTVLPVRGIKLYGQIALDEFKLKEVIKDNRGWWGNKYAWQAGVKWIDALNIPTLDIQAELNTARPYTYTADTSGKNYLHYAQPLAHPAGANFLEGIVAISWFPTSYIQLKLRYMNLQQGKDSTGVNYGGNLLLSNRRRVSEYDNDLLQGVLNKTQLADFCASWHLRHNLFIDLNVLYRIQNTPTIQQNLAYVGLGLRWNYHFPTNYFF